MIKYFQCVSGLYLSGPCIIPGNLCHPGGYVVHPALELRGKQSEEDQQEDDHPKSLVQ